MSSIELSTTRAELDELADLAASSVGADRDLDARVWWATADHSQTDEVGKRIVAEDGVPAFLTTFWPQWRFGDYGRDNPIPLFTSSVDAVLVLLDTRLTDHEGFELIEFEATEKRPEPWTQASVGDVTRDGATRAGGLLSAVLSQMSQDLVEPDEAEAGSGEGAAGGPA